MLSSFAISEQLPDHLLNAQNKELARQIELLQRENDRVGTETEEHKNRLKFMVEHLSNVKAEILSTQQLQDAKRREVESQEHMAQLVERERGRLKQRVEQLAGRRDEEKAMADQVQGRILQSNVRMDELKAAMNFNQEELEQWDVARRQKEDDNEALARYQRADESKVGALRPQVSKLQAAIQARRDDLEEEITATRAAQIELDKTAQDFKTLHDERHGLLNQWEEAVAAMHRRDAAIKMAADRYAEGKEWLGKRQQQLKAREEFLQAEQANTREMNSRIEQEERAMEKMREDFLTLQKHNADLQDELETMRTQLQKAVKDRNNAIAQREHHEELLQAGHRNFELVEAKHRDLIAKVEDEILSAQDLNKQNKLVLDLLAETERSAKELDKEMNRIKDEQYRRGQELFEVRQKQADYLAEISGAQAQGRNTAAKIAQLDQQAFKQQELLYSIDFNVQQMERRVNRARGERTEEEKNELHEKIEMLQKMMDDLDKQHKLLETQVNRVVDDLRHARHATTRLVQEKQRHGEALLELGLQNDSCALELAKLAKRRETALVDGDVQRLQVEGLKRLVRQRDSELMSLENRREQLSLTVVEREKEVAVHHEVLQKEGRVAEDERQRIFTELRERAAQVKALKNRYEVLIGRMDKEVAETTHAQHIVRTAKEREELQVQGDGLDGGIKKAERDLRKLDKTIAMLKGANAQFKHQFSRVGADDEEVLQQKLMKAKAKELQTIVNHRAQEAREVMRSQLDVHAQMQERLDEKAGIEAQVQQAREAAAAMMREADEQQELVARYQSAVEKAARLTDADVAADVALLEEHEALDSDVSAVVRAAGARGPDMRALVAAVLARHGLVAAAA